MYSFVIGNNLPTSFEDEDVKDIIENLRSDLGKSESLHFQLFELPVTNNGFDPTVLHGLLVLNDASCGSLCLRELLANVLDLGIKIGKGEAVPVAIDEVITNNVSSE